MKRMLVGVTTLAMISSGCSIAFLEKPRVTPDNRVECDSTYKMPLIDVAVAAAGISTPFIMEALRDRSMDSPRLPLYFASWAVGLGAAISAVVGYKRVGRCNALEDSIGTSTPPAATTPTPPPVVDAPPAQ